MNWRIGRSGSGRPGFIVWRKDPNYRGPAGESWTAVRYLNPLREWGWLK